MDSFKSINKTRVNLFPIALQIIHSYLKFKSIFKLNNAKYVIEERHYDTNAVKNYLFKKYGGISATTIQKTSFRMIRLIGTWILIFCFPLARLGMRIC